MRVSLEKEFRIKADLLGKSVLESRINEHIFNLEQLDNSSDTELVRVRNEIERLTNEVKHNNDKIQENASIIEEIEKQVVELNNNQGKTTDEHIAERDVLNDAIACAKTNMAEWEEELRAIPTVLEDLKTSIEQSSQDMVRLTSELQN